ncbi:hypothetical protein NC653_041040 [Populus alba x Populus x berolinensis]|uniref:Uncharacterized protein n=1 Tax=Populus alba x Populus x berolinensis TaxID=444605 RepID=A0AAD6L7V3_9ROSI|nr:hypothetical protein NC653_041040 [Populus alba x Populus x berolinensis]
MKTPDVRQVSARGLVDLDLLPLVGGELTNHNAKVALLGVCAPHLLSRIIWSCWDSSLFPPSLIYHPLFFCSGGHSHGFSLGSGSVLSKFLLHRRAMSLFHGDAVACVQQANVVC